MSLWFTIVKFHVHIYANSYEKKNTSQLINSPRFIENWFNDFEGVKKKWHLEYVRLFWFKQEKEEEEHGQIDMNFDCNRFNNTSHSSMHTAKIYLLDDLWQVFCVLLSIFSQCICEPVGIPSICKWHSIIWSEQSHNLENKNEKKETSENFSVINNQFIYSIQITKLIIRLLTVYKYYCRLIYTYTKEKI